MKKVSSIFVIAAMMAAIVFMRCKNNADGDNNAGGINTRQLTSADIYILGSYKTTDGAELSFRDDGTGSYKAGGSRLIRAAGDASIPSFSWSATKSGDTTIITIL